MWCNLWTHVLFLISLIALMLIVHGGSIDPYSHGKELMSFQSGILSRPHSHPNDR